jgi:hypothetical protein
MYVGDKKNCTLEKIAKVVAKDLHGRFALWEGWKAHSVHFEFHEFHGLGPESKLVRARNIRSIRLDEEENAHNSALTTILILGEVCHSHALSLGTTCRHVVLLVVVHDGT